MFENLALETTCRRTMRVSRAALLEPTICLISVVRSAERISDVV
jgi:hypothetical protein